VLPIIPTAARDFAPGDNIAGFVRVFQGGDAPLRSVDMAVQVFDVNDRKLMDTAATLPDQPPAPDEPPAISSTCRSASSSMGRTW
jgi:hypothetical protein